MLPAPDHSRGLHGPDGEGIVLCVHAKDVVAELFRVFTARDWAVMRGLYHPKALIFTVTGGPAPLLASQVIGELERASKEFAYSVTASETVEFDEHAVMVSGRMRRRLPGGGFEDAAHIWVLTARDGLIYRQGVFHDRDEAQGAYEGLGVTLGLSDPAE
jgi:ketosteroid isomerase-like protein